MSTHSFFNKKTTAGFAGWSVLWIALYTLILHSYTPAMIASFIDASLTVAFISTVCILVINNYRYYLPGQHQFWYITGISFALGLLSTGLSTFLLHLIFWNNARYNALISQSWLLRFALAILLIAGSAIIGLLWYSLQDQKETETRNNHAEQMLKEAELFKLRQQLQPHFLFNSLNSISALTISNTHEARHMIQQLSDFLRSTLQRNERQLIPLQEELDQLSLYLQIEKVRFGNRLQTHVEVTDEAIMWQLPALLLQPAVENAIKFGLYDTLDDSNHSDCGNNKS